MRVRGVFWAGPLGVEGLCEREHALPLTLQAQTAIRGALVPENQNPEGGEESRRRRRFQKEEKVPEGVRADI